MKYSRNFEQSGDRREGAEGGWLPGQKAFDALPIKDEDMILYWVSGEKQRAKQICIQEPLLRYRCPGCTGGWWGQQGGYTCRCKEWGPELGTWPQAWRSRMCVRVIYEKGLIGFGNSNNNCCRLRSLEADLWGGWSGARCLFGIHVWMEGIRSGAGQREKSDCNAGLTKLWSWWWALRSEHCLSDMCYIGPKWPRLYTPTSFSCR